MNRKPVSPETRAKMSASARRAAEIKRMSPADADQALLMDMVRHMNARRKDLWREYWAAKTEAVALGEWCDAVSDIEKCGNELRRWSRMQKKADKLREELVHITLAYLTLRDSAGLPTKRLPVPRREEP